MAPETAPKKVGRRFLKSDVPRLRELVDRCHSEGIIREHASLFEKAYEAASRNEPLHVVCETIDEARMVAQGFAIFGVLPPSVEAIRQ